MRDEIERLERLAKEAMRCAIGAANCTTTPERASEALAEFRKAIDPSLFLDLVREHRSQQEKLKEWVATYGAGSKKA
jgi:hypothetical protein